MSVLAAPGFVVSQLVANFLPLVLCYVAIFFCTLLRPFAQTATLNNFNGAESLLFTFRLPHEELRADREYVSCTSLLPMSNPFTGAGGRRYVQQMPHAVDTTEEEDRLLRYLDELKKEFDTKNGRKGSAKLN